MIWKQLCGFQIAFSGNSMAEISFNVSILQCEFYPQCLSISKVI